MKAVLITLSDLIAHGDAIESKFGKDAPIAYANVSMTQLSVARYYGAAKVNGQRYIYSESDDSLIREDVVKFVRKLKREAKQK